MKWQLLHKACWAGDAVEVARLIEAGANPNQVAPTSWRQTPLGRTLEFRITAPKHSGHVDTVRVLLDMGADPNIRSTYLDMTPLELATFAGLEPAADLLRGITRMENPHPDSVDRVWITAASRLPEDSALQDLRRSMPTKQNVNVAWRRATPLMMALGHAGHFRVADELLTVGADPNTATSLLHASCDWHFEHLVPALHYLALHGWDVNARDDKGQTALHKAAFLGYATAVRILLKHGADPTTRDSSGSTAIGVAREAGKRAAVDVLSKA